MDSKWNIMEKFEENKLTKQTQYLANRRPVHQNLTGLIYRPCRSDLQNTRSCAITLEWSNEDEDLEQETGEFILFHYRMLR